jgi:excisionase family DNA binding protein
MRWSRHSHIFHNRNSKATKELAELFQNEITAPRIAQKTAYEPDSANVILDILRRKGGGRHMEPVAYTIDQVCEVANIARQVVFDEINAGRLRARKRGRSTRILAEDLREYLRSLPLFEPKAASRERAQAQHAAAVRHGRRLGSQGRGKK